MDKIYHRTPERNWKSIRRDGTLFPRSNPLLGINKKRLSRGVTDAISSDSYLVGLEDPTSRGWKDFGLMEHLKSYLAREDDYIEVLEIPILEESGAFVRDHSIVSSKTFLELYGADFMNGRERNSIDKKEIYEEHWEQYFETTIPLKLYKGDYKAPEIWIPQQTPLEKITHLYSEGVLGDIFYSDNE